MADADAMLIRKLNVAALEGGNAHTDLGRAFGTRPVISFRYPAEEMATGIFSERATRTDRRAVPVRPV
jgi:hypothetical protein